MISLIRRARRRTKPSDNVDALHDQFTARRAGCRLVGAHLPPKSLDTQLTRLLSAGNGCDGAESACLARLR